MYQSRYLAYCRAQENTPQEQITADREAYPGGAVCGFVLWVKAMWEKYDQMIGWSDKHYHGPKEHNDFDAWLATDPWKHEKETQ